MFIFAQFETQFSAPGDDLSIVFDIGCNFFGLQLLQPEIGTGKSSAAEAFDFGIGLGSALFDGTK